MDREEYRRLRQKGMPPGMARFALEELRHETLQGWMEDGVTRADYMQHTMMTDEEIESAFVSWWAVVLHDFWLIDDWALTAKLRLRAGELEDSKRNRVTCDCGRVWEDGGRRGGAGWAWYLVQAANRESGDSIPLSARGADRIAAVFGATIPPDPPVLNKTGGSPRLTCGGARCNAGLDCQCYPVNKSGGSDVEGK